MQVYLVAADAPIAPFGEPARDAVVGGLCLAAFQDEVLGRLGLSATRVQDLAALPEAAGPCLVLRDNLFISHRALKSFLKRATAAGGRQRLALPESLLMERYHPLQQLERHADGRWLFDAVYCNRLPAGAEPPWQGAEPLCPQFKERRMPARIPRNILGRASYEHPLTTTVAMHIRHWVHILWANNLLPQIRLVERITGSPLGTAWRLVASLGLSRQAMVHRAMRRFVYTGRGCRIHPTARVELSILGDHVEVGAYAQVHASVVGAGTVIEDRANVRFSSLSENTFVSRNSTLVMCAGYPDADLCVNGIQFSLAGRNTALTSFVRQMDMRYGGAVTVLDGGQPVELPGHMLGGCFGHRVFVGPDVVIQAGRAVPNAAVLLPDPDAALSRAPDTWPEGQVGVVRGGRLEPL